MAHCFSDPIVWHWTEYHLWLGTHLPVCLSLSVSVSLTDLLALSTSLNCSFNTQKVQSSIQKVLYSLIFFTWICGVFTLCRCTFLSFLPYILIRAAWNEEKMRYVTSMLNVVMWIWVTINVKILTIQYNIIAFLLLFFFTYVHPREWLDYARIETKSSLFTFQRHSSNERNHPCYSWYIDNQPS